MQRQQKAGGSGYPQSFLRGAAPVTFLVLAAGLAACKGESPSPTLDPASDEALGIAAQSVKPASAEFGMVRSAAAVNTGCLPDAQATVHVQSQGSVEVMRVDVSGLPPKTEFDFFVIQEPNNPFGLAWYQGDIETNGSGRASQKFIGRFNIETFIVGVGSPAAPVIHRDGPFPDAPTSPPTNPVHTFHLGLWFNSPTDAANAGCGGGVTPFNGDHNAGVQILRTEALQNGLGPLSQVQ